MTTITVETLMSYGPCEGYPRERVVELCGGREALTAQQIADLEIPAQDRIWTLCHVLARLDRASLVAFAQSRAKRQERLARYAAIAVTEDDSAKYASAMHGLYATSETYSDIDDLLRRIHGAAMRRAR